MEREKLQFFWRKKRIGQASTKISNKKGAVAFFFLILLWHRLKNLANQGCSKLSIGRFQTTLLPLLGFSVLCSKFGQFEDWISFALELLRRQMLPLFSFLLHLHAFFVPTFSKLSSVSCSISSEVVITLVPQSKGHAFSSR